MWNYFFECLTSDLLLLRSFSRERSFETLSESLARFRSGERLFESGEQLLRSLRLVRFCEREIGERLRLISLEFSSLLAWDFPLMGSGDADDNFLRFSGWMTDTLDLSSCFDLEAFYKE